MAPAPRYALYFAPERSSPFWRFGCAWLGRDPETGEAVVRPPLTGPAAADWDEAGLAALTGSPASYGFHATLKPPFRLAEGRSLDDLERAAAAFAAEQAPFACADVRVSPLGRFIAFRLLDGAAPMQALADAAVERLDAFRAPPSESELAKRRASGLTERQEKLLARWGYPYVFEEFRFHMTLTGALADDAKRARLARSLGEMAAAAEAAGPMQALGVALYEQNAPGAPFRLLRRLPFGV